MGSVTVNQTGSSVTIGSASGGVTVVHPTAPDIVVSDTGLQGPPGPSGGAVDADYGDITVAAGVWEIDTFREDFASPLPIWVVNHNLNRRVAVETYTAGGTEFMAEIVRVDSNQIRVEMDVPSTGFVIVS